MSAFRAEDSHAINRWTLAFDDAEAEAEYRLYEPERRVPFIRSALLLVIPLICLFGVIDSILISDVVGNAWKIRGYLIVYILLAFGLTYSQLNYNYLQAALVILILVLGGCNIALVLASPGTVHYYVGLVLIMIYCYVSGLRFPYAVVTCTVILLASLGFLLFSGTPGGQLALEAPMLIAGYVVATFTGHVSEKQRRELFAQASLMDIQRRQQAQMAMHDPLTGLPNRHLLNERMAQSLARAKRQGTQFAVMFIDLDNFKVVNDRFGHVIGDQVLKVIAERLRDHVRREDTAARFGGDEFIVLSEHVGDEHGVEIAARRLLSTISHSIVVKAGTGHAAEIRLTGSMGISLCPKDGDSLDELINHADQAMYMAKRDGEGSMRFFGDGDLPLTEVQ